MILEIYLTLALVGIVLFILGIIQATETENPLLIFISIPFLIITSYSSGMIELTRVAGSAFITETVSYGYLMVLFGGLSLLAAAMALVYSLISFKD